MSKVQPKIIDPESLNDAQLTKFTKDFIAVPWFLKINYEVIPAFVTPKDDDPDGEIIPYRVDRENYCSEQVDDYIVAHGDELMCGTDPADAVANMQPNRRMLVQISHLGRETAEGDKNDGWDGVSTMLDIQSMWPVGMDVWSVRFQPIARHFIAPLAMLVPEINQCYGLSVDKDTGVVMCDVGGTGRSSVATIWTALGGIIPQELSSFPESACIITLEYWGWESRDFQKALEQAANSTFKLAKKRLGEKKYNQLRNQCFADLDDYRLKSTSL